MLRSRIAPLVLCALVVAGCSSTYTQKKGFVEVDNAVAEQNYSLAARSLEESKKKYFSEKDRVLFYLDTGMLYHYCDETDRSNQSLSSAEDDIDELYTKSISAGIESLLLNDNALAYSGEDYENVYLNIFKALNYVEENKFDDAFVEVRRADYKLATLEDKYTKMADMYNQSPDAKKRFSVSENRFTNSAFARFISMLMYRTDGKYDDARIDADKINEAWNTEAALYDFDKPDVSSWIQDEDKARLDVVSLVGKSPELFARVLTIHTFKDAVAIYQSDGKKEKRLEMFPWDGMKDGYHFKFSLPYMEKKGTSVARVTVELNGGEVGNMQTIESIENVAEETYKLHEGITYLKTIIRTIVKGLLNEKANEELDKKTGGGVWGSLTRAATSAAVDVSENADLRLSRYFPARALVQEVRVDPGTYHLVLKYYSSDGTLLHADDKGTITVRANALNLFRSVFLN
ncbi:MAG TPA: hypothetical protein VIS48_08585 [Candidatus Kryptonia bacterium]